MIEKEKQQQGGYGLKFRWLMFIPVMIMVGIVPLIVRLVKTDIPDERILYLTNNNLDLFSQAKSSIIMALVGMMLLFAFLGLQKKDLKKDRVSLWIYGSAMLFCIMTLIATFISEYDFVAKWGLPNRAEGGYMLVCYILMMLYTYWVIRQGKDYRYIVIPLGIVALLVSMIGFMQYIGKDPFLTEFMKQMIIPEHYVEDRAGLQNIHEAKHVYGTMFHYNYVGSFTALVIPLFVTMACFVKGYKKKIACGCITICSGILLFASTSRAGLIGVVCAGVVFCIVFGRSMLRQWKALVGVIIVGILLVVGLDQVTEGAIFGRIPALVQDIVSIMKPSDEVVDYKTILPIKNITHENGSMTVHMQEQSLTIANDGEKLVFTDQNGEKIQYIYMALSPDNISYFTQDPRFEAYKIVIGNQEGTLYGKLMYNNMYLTSISIEEEVHLVDHFTKESIPFEEPESIGFKGKEKLGSSRGYIWSRSLPMLKDTWLVGYGPDTYGFAFPQNDLLGKWYAYENPNMVVDKVHNLYLQIAIQEGGVALIAFLVLVGVYLIQSMRLYAFKKTYDEKSISGIAFMLAVVGYLGAGMFNDSVVSVAPIFWVLLGAGMAVNYIVHQERITAMKNSPHGVIDMKTKKHS
ncbi:MAG: O-antigen ligase family protein [Cellulosilyticaceae bacterium]